MSHVSSAGSFAFSFEPIGYIESCFSRLRAIPRQGALAPATRANLVLAPGLQSCTVEGLEQFSHVWITFVFHDNTVATNKARPTIDRGRAGTGQGNGFAAGDYRAKIMPPKYGHKVGVFATRSPHRPNPIGQTVVRLESVYTEKCIDKATGRQRMRTTLRLSAIDFVDGTPVLDIKPYVGFYDAVPPGVGLRMAPWVPHSPSGAVDDRTREKNTHASGKLSGCSWGTAGAPSRGLTVNFTEQARKDLAALVHLMRFYKHSAVEAEEAVKQVLALDIQDGGAKIRRTRRGDAVDGGFCCPFDNLEFVAVPVKAEASSEEVQKSLRALAVVKVYCEQVPKTCAMSEPVSADLQPIPGSVGHEAGGGNSDSSPRWASKPVGLVDGRPNLSAREALHRQSVDSDVQAQQSSRLVFKLDASNDSIANCSVHSDDSDDDYSLQLSHALVKEGSELVLADAQLQPSELAAAGAKALQQAIDVFDLPDTSCGRQLGHNEAKIGNTSAMQFDATLETGNVLCMDGSGGDPTELDAALVAARRFGGSNLDAERSSFVRPSESETSQKPHAASPVVDILLQLSSDTQTHRLFVYLQDREGRYHKGAREAGQSSARVVRPRGLPKCFLKLEGYTGDPEALVNLFLHSFLGRYVVRMYLSTESIDAPQANEAASEDPLGRGAPVWKLLHRQLEKVSRKMAADSTQSDVAARLATWDVVLSASERKMERMPTSVATPEKSILAPAVALRVQAYPAACATAVLDWCQTSPLAALEPRNFDYALHCVLDGSGTIWTALAPARHFYRYCDPRGVAEDQPAAICRAGHKLAELAQLAAFPALKSEWRVLDVGSSPGGWTDFLASKVGHVVSIDPASPPQPVVHPAVLARHPQGKITPIRGKVEELTGALQAHAPFDLVVCDMCGEPALVAAALVPSLWLLRSGGCLVATLKCVGQNHNSDGNRSIDRDSTATTVDERMSQFQKLLAETEIEFAQPPQLVVWLLANSTHERTIVLTKC